VTTNHRYRVISDLRIYVVQRDDRRNFRLLFLAVAVGHLSLTITTVPILQQLQLQSMRLQ